MKKLVTLLLLFIPLFTFSQSFKKGDAIQIEWKGQWYNGKIEEVKGDKYLISYDGYDASWNETVGADRIKAGTSKTTATSSNSLATVESDGTKRWAYSGVETIWDMVPSPDGKYVLATSAYSKLYILNASDLTYVSEIKITDYPASTGTWSPDGNYIATGDGNGRTYIYKKTGEAKFAFYDSIPGYSMMTKMRFSPVNNDLLIASAPAEDYTDTQIEIWDTDKKKMKKKILTSTNADHSVSDIEWSNDGTKIAVAISNKKKGILLYDSSGKQTKVITHTHDVTTVAFSPDGSTLASGGIDGKVTLWNLSNYTKVWSQEWKTGTVEYLGELAFAPDGLSIAACGSGYGTPIKLYHASSGSVKCELGTSNPRGNAIFYSSDSKNVYIAYTTYGDAFKVTMINKFEIPEK